MKYLWFLPIWAVLASPAALADGHTLPAPETLRQLALRFEHGEGVKKDQERALRLYCLSARAGDMDSAHNLGWMYLNGRGTEVAETRAVYWLQKARELGDTHADRLLTHLSDIQPQIDQRCPNLVKGANQKTVSAWIEVLAPEFDLDPNLVKQIVRAESAFNPKALSHAQAHGLMQLIPDTARRFGVRDIWDPASNLAGGMAYLHWLLRRYEGDVAKTLAAYNAGERRVDRINGIPKLKETQVYVKKILRWYGKDTHPIPAPLPSEEESERK